VLGLVAEAEEKFEEALHLYRTALADAETVKAAMEAAYAKHDLGTLLTRLGQSAEAISFLESAHAAWVEQGNLLLQEKSNAHLGLAVLAVGDQTRAKELAASGWVTLRAGLPVGEQPQDWLWALYRLMIALDQTEHAPDVLRTAYAELQRQAKNISDLNLRRSFFERVPLNRDIVWAFDQLSAIPRVISTSLARKDTPLGRSLRQDDYVTVQWTVNAPEDEAITDKSARRQFQLKRLLEQAEAQNAAPTDENLAHALGVSRRTILRDMKELAQEIPKPPTRKRKN
jgi:tetratricopeptide (TPR) repeat protein